jgi:hypothetical protein
LSGAPASQFIGGSDAREMLRPVMPRPVIFITGLLHQVSASGGQRQENAQNSPPL